MFLTHSKTLNEQIIVRIKFLICLQIRTKDLECISDCGERFFSRYFMQFLNRFNIKKYLVM